MTMVSPIFQLFLYILDSSQELSLAERNLVAEFLLQAYQSQSYNFTLTVIILTLLDQRGIGKLAFTFNFLLKKALRQGIDKTEALTGVFALALNHNLAFPELFDNDELNSVEKDRLKDDYVYYLSQTSYLLRRAEIGDTDNLLEILNSCTNPCGDLCGYSKVPNHLIVVDLDGDYPISSKIDMAGLIRQLANGNYLNPQTGKPFSVKTLESLNKRLRIELSMYKKFSRSLLPRTV